MGTPNKNSDSLGLAICVLIVLLAITGGAIGYALSKTGFEVKATVGGAACGVIVSFFLMGAAASREDDEDQN